MLCIGASYVPAYGYVHMYTYIFAYKHMHIHIRIHMANIPYEATVSLRAMITINKGSSAILFEVERMLQDELIDAAHR